MMDFRFLTRVALAVVVAVLSFSPLAAVAACTAGPGILDRQLPAANDIVAQSANATLRTNYGNNDCVIRAIMHQSGRPCIAGQGNNHVTVESQNTTYHVFDYNAAGTNYKCTTP